MPDLDELAGKDVRQEPPNELVGVQRHDLALVVVGVIPPPERHLVVFKLDQPVIADRDPVGVFAEVVDNILGLFKRRLGVRNPLRLIQFREQCVKGPRRFEVAGVFQFTFRMEFLEVAEELPRKSFDSTFTSIKKRPLQDFHLPSGVKPPPVTILCRWK